MRNRESIDGTSPVYHVLSISTYPSDLAVLDAKVKELKARGFIRANRSSLIRLAIERLDIDSVGPKELGGHK